jgi:tRNA pseudouridine32 synthase/23S rRNA pseudouridine746 synthase
MQEVDGIPNSETRIDVQQREGPLWRYVLQPITGRKHQLRVHMAALGAPITNDPTYPEPTRRAQDDYTRPMQLLARALAFVDPLTHTERHFESGLVMAIATRHP